MLLKYIVKNYKSIAHPVEYSMGFPFSFRSFALQRYIHAQKLMTG